MCKICFRFFNNYLFYPSDSEIINLIILLILFLFFCPLPIYDKNLFIPLLKSIKGMELRIIATLQVLADDFNKPATCY